MDFANYGIHHGPGLDSGINLVKTPYVLTCDNDIIFKRKNLIEDMMNQMGPDVYAVGWMIYVEEKKGVSDRSKTGAPYVIPRCMLLNRVLYFQYPPAVKHGNPMCKAFIYMHQEKVSSRLIHFDIKNYIEHEKRGTKNRGQQVSIVWKW